jgi:mono/diheme cytochrome c family protein
MKKKPLEVVGQQGKGISVEYRVSSRGRSGNPSPRQRRQLVIGAASSIACALILFTSGALPVTALAVPVQGADKQAGGGLYTDEQSTRGESISAKSCTVCHGDQLKGTDLAPGLQGDDFLKGWTGKPAGPLFEKIQTTMPANEPGTLSDQQTADLIAYILKLNHFPAGQAELPKDPAALKGLALAPK